MSDSRPSPRSVGPKRRLRIAFAADLVGGARNGGVLSAERFLAALRERHDVTVLATGPAGPGVVPLPSFTVPPFGQVMREMGFTFAWPRAAELERAIGDADVLHVHFPFLLGMRATAVARRLGTPVVAGSHVQPENLLLNVGIRSARLADWTWALFTRTVYARADAVVCPSDFARDELLRHGLSVPIEVISNGIPAGFTPDLSAREATSPRSFLLLSVGRLAREKRLEVVIEGVRRSRHAERIRLVIVGGGPEAPRVRELAATLPIPGEVVAASDEELLRLLRSADLFVHASEAELEGMAVLEALGCGLPALIADAPRSAARHLALAADLRFGAGDPSDLARRLDALLEAPGRLANLRFRALQAAHERSLESSVARLEALYERVARRPNGAVIRAVAPGVRSRASPGAR